MTLDPAATLHREIGELGHSGGTCASCVMETKHSYTSNTCRNRAVSLNCIFVIVMVSVILIPTEVRGMPRSLLCDSNARCLHGGVLRLPDTPFGFCRCMCEHPYVGPRCQFNRLGNGRTRKLNRLKRLVRLKQQFRDWLNTNMNSSES